MNHQQLVHLHNKHIISIKSCFYFLSAQQSQLFPPFTGLCANLLAAYVEQTDIRVVSKKWIWQNAALDFPVESGGSTTYEEVVSSKSDKSKCKKSWHAEFVQCNLFKDCLTKRQYGPFLFSN